MKMPLEITYRDVVKTDSIDTIIREKAAGLEKVNNNITSCRVAVERPHGFVRTGNQYRVRLDITVPGVNEIVVNKEPGKNEMHAPLVAVIRDAFKVAKRQLQDLTEKQRNEVKKHPEQEVSAIILNINKEEGYGFIKGIDGREIYFHRNSVINGDFEKLVEGTGVRFKETLGEKGPQATSVQILETGKGGKNIDDALGEVFD